MCIGGGSVCVCGGAHWPPNNFIVCVCGGGGCTILKMKLSTFPLGGDTTPQS